MTPFLLLGSALMIWSFWIEPRWLKVRQVSVKLKTPWAHPFTVLHVSDSHFPLHLRKLERFFRKLSKLHPDLIVLTGDIIDNDLGIEPCTRALSHLKSRFGIYAVLGNHDHYNYRPREIVGFLFTFFREHFSPQRKNNVPKLKERLEKVGCKVLVNQNLVLGIHGQKLCLVGVDDPVTRKADPEKAFQNVQGADAKILLTHSLDILQRLNGHSVDLALGGHTHGGQISIPFWGPLPLKTHSRMGRKFIAGLSCYQETITYTSRGIGEGRFLPFRFLCRPEAVLFEIH